MKERLTGSELLASFNVANTYMGALVGPSLVAGTYATFYFLGQGAWALILAFFAVGLVGYEAWGFGWLTRRYSIRDYGTYARIMYKNNKFLCLILEIFVFGAMVNGAAVVQNMAGTFMNELIGVTPVVGMIIIAAISILLCVFDSKLVRAANSVMSVIMLIGFLVMTAIIIIGYGDKLWWHIANWYVPEGAFLPKGIWDSVLFAVLSCGGAMTLCCVSEPIKKDKQGTWVGLFIFIVTGSLMCLNCICFLPFTDEVLGEFVPIVYVMDNYINPIAPWFPTVYYIVMLLAIISSLIPNMYIVAGRAVLWVHKPAVPGTKDKKYHIINFFFCCLFALLVSVFASFGINDLLSYGFNFFSYLAIPFIFIPGCIIWPIRFIRAKKGKYKLPPLDNPTAKPGEY